MSPSELVELLLPRKPALAKSPTGVAIADAVAKGLPKESIERVKRALALTDAEVAASLGMSPKSVSRLRRSARHLLDLVPSDRLYRLAHIFSLALDVLEEEGAAREWLRAPQTGLGLRVPLDLCATEAGAREVEDLLGRMEAGVLS